MSIPLNPLSNFRSYSYHQILMICDNVETATSVSNNDNISKFIKNTDDGQITDVSLLTDAKTQGKYVILANGLSNAKYVIESLKWASFTGQMGDNGSDNFTSMATEGNISIVEPKGLKFLNEVQKSYKLLNSDPTACVWMVKTIFVGYNDQYSGEKSSYITNIRPLIFFVIDLTADFNIEGGFYNISFVNINNGAGKLPQFLKSTETIKLNIGDDSTLRNSMKLLEEKLLKNSKRHFNSVKDSVEQLGLEPKAVTYKIVLDQAYDNNYLVDDSQQQNKTDGTEEGGCHLDFSKSITIENAIKTIMRHCSKVKADKDYGFKITSILNSSKTKHEMIYYVNRYKLVFSDIFSAVNNTDQATQQAIKENTLTFDYIYSGKNIDILDFSMKMELGLVFFQTLISSNNIGNQATRQDANSSATGQIAKGKPEDVNQAKGNDEPKKPILPIFFSTTVKNLENTNSKNPKESTEFQALLNRHAAIENLNAKMKIHGNPSLLNSINKIPENYNTISKIRSNDVDGAPALPHWETVPALAKVNIFMPTVDNDGVVSREKFWYDGLYYILGVTNEFNDGAFTQELDMISIPNSINDESDESATKDKTTEVNTTNNSTNIKSVNTSTIEHNPGSISNILGLHKDKVRS